MTDLDELIRFVASLSLARECTTRLQFEATDVPLKAFAEESGLFRKVGLADRLSCPFCPVPHSTNVVYTQDAYLIDCVRVTDPVLTEDDITLFEPSIPMLVKLMRAALTLRAGRARTHADGHLIDLGFVEKWPFEKPWYALFGMGLLSDTAMAATMSALSKDTPKGPGLLITADPIPRSMPLPSRFRWASPSEIWRVEDDRLETDVRRTNEMLGFRRQRKPGGGRINRLEDVRTAVARFSKSSDWPDVRTAQKNYLQNNWPDDLGVCPSKTTLFEKLSELLGPGR